MECTVNSQQEDLQKLKRHSLLIHLAADLGNDGPQAQHDGTGSYVVAASLI